jgi:hypothetical protein
MNWSDYEAVWKRQEPPVGANADLPALFASFESRSRKMHAVLMVRDLAEAGAGILVSSFYVFFWLKMGKGAWPMALAIVLILGVSAIFVRERSRARRYRLSADASLLAKVENDIALLRHQRRMVKSLWIWYLGPCAAAMFIQCSVIYRREPAWSPLHEPVILLIFGAFFALLFWFAWEINRRALRKRIEPRLQELEKMHANLRDP